MPDDNYSVGAGVSLSISLDHRGEWEGQNVPTMAQPEPLDAVQQAVDASISEDAPGSVSQASISNLKQSRKRTKTGCLTCRKRRIKCGEERPSCNNCIKSKRNCEGYTQRVIFKHPVGSYRQVEAMDTGQGVHIQHITMRDGYCPQYGDPSTPSATQAPLLPLAPRPVFQDGVSNIPGTPDYGPSGQNPLYGSSFVAGGPYISGDVPPPMREYYNPPSGLDWGSPKDKLISFEDSRRQSFSPPRPSSMYASSIGLQGFQGGSGAQSAQDGRQLNRSNTQASNDVDQQTTFFKRRSLGDNVPGRFTETEFESEPKAPLKSSQNVNVSRNVSQFMPPPYGRSSTAESVAQKYPFTPGPRVKVEPLNAIHGWKGSGAGRRFSVEGFVQQTSFDTKIPTQPVHPIAPTPLGEDPDDFYDIESDEDMEPAPPTESNLGLMLALSASQDDRHVRSYTSFLNEPNVLATYRPAVTASPLMDPQTARIFCHFVTSTGPSLSIYERHPTNPSLMFSGFPVPASQQALWTYTLPTMALSHQALLHSMLALASLHISKLQQTSPTPSLKHYHYALRRVAKAVGLPQRRPEIGTLAATLLLGFYEAMTAEHSKWSSHLLGAKQLVMEIDFSGMTRRIWALREEIQQKKRRHQLSSINGMGYGQQEFVSPEIDDLLPDKEFEVDGDLVSLITGYSIQYDHHGRITEGVSSESMNSLTTKDLETYKIQSDLFWWFAKQDCFQAMVSGNRLLMPFDRWVYCPPRGPFGTSSYATMDHAILIVGRLADFAGKDQRRKKKVVEMNGGHWKPPQGFSSPGMSVTPGAKPFDKGKPSADGSTKAPSPPKSSPVPAMTGMIPPPPRPAKMPDAFAPHGCPQGDKSPTEGAELILEDAAELEAQLHAAEREWQAIDHALNVFEESLPPEFHPLGPEHTPPIATPFGPALQYRTFAQSCIWVFFLTGRILHQRTHPSMPPAAMMAAGIAAAKTAEYANRIGRTCAGIYPQERGLTSMNPTLGAALIESTMGLFFAGVQYMDPAQRGWTITKLRDIARLTGWQSSAAIAAGCEIAWEQAGIAGRGPPYTRTMDPMAKDERVAGRKPENSTVAPSDHNDRRFIVGNPGTRVHWALGILSVEEDVKKLDLGRD